MASAANLWDRRVAVGIIGLGYAGLPHARTFSARGFSVQMPAFVVNKVADALNDRGQPVKGSKVLLLGMAYKKDVDDPRESPGFELMDLLRRKGAVVGYNDPHIPGLPRMRHWPHLGAMGSTPLTPEALAAQDCVLIATDHTAYDYAWVVRHSKLVIDTRDANKPVGAGRGRMTAVGGRIGG